MPREQAFADRTARGVRPNSTWKTDARQLEYERTPTAVRHHDNGLQTANAT